MKKVFFLLVPLVMFAFDSNVSMGQKFGEYLRQIYQDPEFVSKSTTKCEINNQWDSCYDLYKFFWNLSMVPDDKRKASYYLQKSCEIAPEICTDIGMKFIDGVDIEKNYTVAVRMFEMGCNNNFADSCFKLASFYNDENKDHQKTNYYFKKSCDLKLGIGCFNMGVIYFNGNTIKQNRSEAKKFFGLACDYGYENGCSTYKKLNQ